MSIDILPQTTADDRAASGITLLETVVSLLILGGAFVAAMNTIASARGTQALLAHRESGMLLAEDLMDEVMGKALYKESAQLGPEIGERDGTRANFDDVDDYHGWSASPPVDSRGQPIPGADGYRRTVEVSWVDAQSPLVEVSRDQGAVRIDVSVWHGKKLVAQLQGYRTDAWQSPQERY